MDGFMTYADPRFASGMGRLPRKPDSYGKFQGISQVSLGQGDDHLTKDT